MKQKIRLFFSIFTVYFYWICWVVFVGLVGCALNRHHYALILLLLLLFANFLRFSSMTSSSYSAAYARAASSVKWALIYNDPYQLISSDLFLEASLFSLLLFGQCKCLSRMRFTMLWNCNCKAFYDLHFHKSIYHKRGNILRLFYFQMIANMIGLFRTEINKMMNHE